MKPVGSDDYFATFQPYVDYYGAYDYADKIITAAFDGTDVELNGKTWNFSQLGYGGRARTYFQWTA